MHALIQGKKIGADEASISGKAKPRVAQSKRGRELRAEAALKRFEKKKEEEEVKVEDDYDETASESEDEKKAVNVGGGKFMIAVSGEEDGKGESEKMDRELMELLGGACRAGTSKPAPEGKSAPTKPAWSAAHAKSQLKEEATYSSHSSSFSSDTNPDSDSEKMKRPLSSALHTPYTRAQPTAELDASPANHSEPTTGVTATTSQTCPICSFTNTPHASTCMACMNVLTLAASVGSSWTCSNVLNCPREYRNSGDVAFCGICGSRKPSSS
ncbi:hypothetical protein K440DRAFT_617486 [Wilcoxina mikolae CBS 423.85]|nr:hypothetical protein K440DRAFT_617486 [Wilcoxina mikolae CBS 423.85]